jgi:23S rRNA (guanosine2251-2'-O)-methyltransferase
MSQILVGRKPILEALKAKTSIEQIVILQGTRGQVIEEICTLAEQSRIRVKEVAKHEFEALSEDMMTQGVIALLTSRTHADLQSILERIRSRGLPGFLLICDQIEDPQNLGALVRTAECAGVHGVIIPRHHASPVTHVVVKASAGATEHIPIAQVTNIVSTIEELKQEGYWVVGLSMEGERFFDEVDYTGHIAVVVGNEGRGIRRLVKEHCDHLVRIPLYGNIESLNASVAGALVMYEVARQRNRGNRQAPPSKNG